MKSSIVSFIIAICITAGIVFLPSVVGEYLFNVVGDPVPDAVATWAMGFLALAVIVAVLCFFYFIIRDDVIGDHLK